jgi:hypothetical protein
MAAQAALLQTMFLVAIWAVYTYMMSTSHGMQMDDWASPSKMSQFMVDHKSLFTFLFGMDWFFAITVFVLAAAYTQKFSRKQPWLGIVIGGFGVISSALFLAAGTIGIYGIKMAVLDYSAQGGLGFMKSVMLAQTGVEMSAVAAVGVVTFATALASARTKSFSAWVNWAGYVGGFSAVAGLVLSVISPALGSISMLGMLGSILFNLGVAMYFMKKPQPELDFSAQMS